MGCSNSKKSGDVASGAKDVDADAGGAIGGGAKVGGVRGDLRYNMLKATKTANFDQLYEVRNIPRVGRINDESGNYLIFV